ncbi:hypothetical protein [Williamsia sp. CHRR-6]|uniref:hypothetical protein n=1 Tax=Williamsia sp. CHRR-6 TaxID=2835871 RepID=UPI001BDB03E4|nr:hypothetical protein [Williamsia sp. CHRR-6]MBT0567513.1 hypothetical protein [Williamsia sp. CHRR-6]
MRSRITLALRTVLLATLLAAGLTTAACSSDSGRTTTPSTATSTVTVTASQAAPPATTSPTEPPPSAAPTSREVDRTSADFARPGSTEGAFDFRSPSGAIFCTSTPQVMVCGTPGIRIPNIPADQLCGIYPEEASGASRFGFLSPSKPACATMIQGSIRRDSPVLGYGQRVSFALGNNTVRCSMSIDGVRCQRSDGPSMFVSKTRFARG